MVLYIAQEMPPQGVYRKSETADKRADLVDTIETSVRFATAHKAVR